ncbi:hypothetical protein [Cyanobium sp. Cruz CV11-17]|uniref:hypothetical protein n=1 Tax=Cyanobium sp. Cruz CV11-17 TaxID=2823709 RepID=UPI0020CC227A|nr:hypothetical protein [Cyanobium sp. Cruz CV11-17]
MFIVLAPHREFGVRGARPAPGLEPGRRLYGLAGGGGAVVVVVVVPPDGWGRFGAV